MNEHAQYLDALCCTILLYCRHRRRIRCQISSENNAFICNESVTCDDPFCTDVVHRVQLTYPRSSKTKIDPSFSGTRTYTRTCQTHTHNTPRNKLYYTILLEF